MQNATSGCPSNALLHICGLVTSTILYLYAECIQYSFQDLYIHQKFLLIPSPNLSAFSYIKRGKSVFVWTYPVWDWLCAFGAKINFVYVLCLLFLVYDLDVYNDTFGVYIYQKIILKTIITTLCWEWGKQNNVSSIHVPCYLYMGYGHSFMSCVYFAGFESV